MIRTGPEFSTINDVEQRDLSTTRIYEIAHNKIFIKREDPYGLWYINYEKGQIPEHLRGAYTSPSQAETALYHYLDRKNKTIAGEETHKVKSVTT